MMRDFYYWLDFDTVPHIAGVPRFLYRAFFAQAGHWLARAGDEQLERFVEELSTIRMAGLLWHRWTQMRHQVHG
jgi:hypothetical protein